jgi:iron complex outermembrane receptor protein
MSFKKTLLSSAINKIILGGTAMALGSVAVAQTRGVTGTSGIDEIKVSALIVNESTNLVAAPFSLLNAENIFTKGGTLGDLLNGLPGVHSDSFGGGASRPVIRGQTSPRITVLSDSSTILDASDISPDHAVTVDPLLVRQIEVLRGPATLLYGGGAIGGVVNILDQKIPVKLPESGFEGFASIRGNTAAKERAGAVSMTGKASDNIALHFESSLRETDDYKARNWDESRVDGTFARSVNGSLGTSWIGESGFIGMAYSYRDDKYGLPGHSDEYAACHPHGSALHCGSHNVNDGHDHDHDHNHEDAPYIDLVSERIDLKGEYFNPVSGIESMRFRASRTNYEHGEMDEGEAVTVFGNKGYDVRVDITHAPILGLQGIIGAQWSDINFNAVGQEAFVPQTDSRAIGVFLVEHYQLNEDWHLEAGLRYDRQSHKPVNDSRNRPEYKESAFSYSGAAIWKLTEDMNLSATYSRAERLPHAQELYARGIHLATNTYECGLVRHPLTCGGAANNAEIEKETADNFEIGLYRYSGDITYSINLFRNYVDDYIYARTLDQYEDIRLIKYTQRDIRFTGFEAELRYQFNDSIAATIFGDHVHAKMKGDDRLPRVSPQRYGARLDVEIHDNISAGVEYYRVVKQTRTAEFETMTPGYDMLNMDINYSVGDDNKYLLFVRASNLLNQVVQNHTSFLANVVPMPARNFSAGVKVNF